MGVIAPSQSGNVAVCFRGTIHLNKNIIHNQQSFHSLDQCQARSSSLLSLGAKERNEKRKKNYNSHSYQLV